MDKKKYFDFDNAHKSEKNNSILCPQDLNGWKDGRDGQLYRGEGDEGVQLHGQ